MMHNHINKSYNKTNNNNDNKDNGGLAGYNNTHTHDGNDLQSVALAPDNGD